MQTSSQAITADANEIIRVTDSRGRVIGFRQQLGVLERYHMHQQLGGEESDNQTIVIGYALPAFLSAEIDGLPLPPLGATGRTPSSRTAFEGRLQLLGDEGINAILEWFAEESRKGAEEQARAREDAVSAIKN